MGRVKLKIKRLENSSSRQVTYSKRKAGILKKAKELSILCDIDLLLIMFAPNAKPTICIGDRSNIEKVVERFAQVSLQERTKRKLESLEALKKTFKKLDHDVNIQEFLGSSEESVEDLTNHLRSLHGQLLEVQKRLSCWADPDKINNLDHIRAMEQSLKESLNRIQVHKENCGKQLISVDYNGQFHKDMHLPMGLSYAQGASSVSWLHDNDGQPLMISQDANLIPHRDVGCSSDTALQNYPAYFNADKQTKADEQVTDESFHNFSPNTCLRLQLGAQFSYQTYGQNLLSERMFKPEMEHSLQESTIDYQVHHFETPGMGYDASFHDWASTSGNCGVAIYDERSYTQQQ
ncbi:agamous-like MADS-box protein AGL65 [Zingiber officinale]|uniref:agamous-like MADS-box protein AGL65 n=1 Tax=Zingiber officinale TaxID=94328 RepID=UPI001C4B5B60|nr:agamous-like MADS-box protein AGL65 [Zingiber officinale]